MKRLPITVAFALAALLALSGSVAADHDDDPSSHIMAGDRYTCRTNADGSTICTGTGRTQARRVTVSPLTGERVMETVTCNSRGGLANMLSRGGDGSIGGDRNRSRRDGCAAKVTLPDSDDPARDRVPQGQRPSFTSFHLESWRRITGAQQGYDGSWEISHERRFNYNVDEDGVQQEYDEEDLSETRCRPIGYSYTHCVAPGASDPAILGRGGECIERRERLASGLTREWRECH